MKRNTLIGLIVAGVCMIPVICVLLVGIIDGIWPWDKEVEYPLLSIILPKETEPEETTDPTQEGTEDATEGTEGSEPVAQGGQQIGGNQQSGGGQQSGGEQATETTGPQSSTTLPQSTTGNNDLTPGDEVIIEIEGDKPTESTTGSTTPAGSDMIPEPTEDRTQSIDFKDLMEILMGGSSNSTESTNG